MISAIHQSLAKKRQMLENDDKGFTLIELLVVVLIIGILAAIAIPVFLGQQNQAKDAAAKSDLANAKVAMISYATDHAGTYLGVSDAAATKTALSSYGYVSSIATAANGVQVKTVGASGVFCLQATSDAANIFHITDSTGTAPAVCP